MHDVRTRGFGKALIIMVPVLPSRRGTLPAIEKLFELELSTNKKGEQMLGWTLIFLIIALIAGVLGFTGLAGTAMGIARILFFIFLILFLVSLVLRLAGR